MGQRAGLGCTVLAGGRAVREEVFSPRSDANTMGSFFPPRLWSFNLSARALFTHIRLQKGEVKRSLIQHMKLCV